MDDARLFALLDEHAPWRPTSLVPSLSAWHADDELPLWSALEAAVGERVAPPFFAVAWPGAQGMARAIEDGVVRIDRAAHVVDVGAGSGVAAAAAARTGGTGAHVVALDVDPLAVRAAAELARRNGVHVDARVADALLHPEEIGAASVVLAADLVYGEAIASSFRHALDTWRRCGAQMVVADSGRPFFDARSFGLAAVCRYDVVTPRALDGKAARTVTIYR